MKRQSFSRPHQTQTSVPFAVIFFAILAISGSAVASPEALFERSLVKFVNDPSAEEGIRALRGADKKNVSMALAWFMETPDLVEALGARGPSLFLACDTNGTSVIIRYMNGQCVALLVQPTGDRRASVTTQLMQVKTFRLGLIIEAVFSNGRFTADDLYEGPPPATFKLRGLRSLQEVPGHYVGIGSSGGWEFQFVVSSFLKIALDQTHFGGAVLNGRIQPDTVGGGPLYFDVMHLKSASSPFALKIQY